MTSTIRWQEIGGIRPGYQSVLRRYGPAVQEVWNALTSASMSSCRPANRHHRCAAIHQKFYDNGYIYKGNYEAGTAKVAKVKTKRKSRGGRRCPNHKVPVRRLEPCYFFAQSKFQER